MIARRDFFVDVSHTDLSSVQVDLPQEGHPHCHVVLFCPIPGKADCAFFIIVHPATSIAEIVLLTPKVIYRDTELFSGCSTIVTYLPALTSISTRIRDPGIDDTQ